MDRISGPLVREINERLKGQLTILADSSDEQPLGLGRNHRPWLSDLVWIALIFGIPWSSFFSFLDQTRTIPTMHGRRKSGLGFTSKSDTASAATRRILTETIES
jgi:hypothetical protein